MISVLNRKRLMQTAGVGMCTCFVFGSYVFADASNSSEYRIAQCSDMLEGTLNLIGSDWSTETSIKEIPKLNEQLYDTVSCIDKVEARFGVTSKTSDLRAQIQVAIEDYMTSETRQQTAVTWVLDSYSKRMTETLISRSS